jgi:hypothetical protein
LGRTGDRSAMIHRWAIVVSLLAASATASDIWIVRGTATGAFIGCTTTRWVADPLLHNLSNEEAVVTVLHVSNGGEVDASPSANIPAKTAVSLKTLGLGGFGGLGPLSVVRLDVPDTIAVEGRLELFAASCAIGQPPPPAPFAKLRLPTFSALVPAGREQVHLGTDLGGQTVRLNVAIYNAATVPASATITVRRPVCGGEPIVTHVTIGPDSIQQAPILDVVPCKSRTDSPDWATDVIVFVDQPSFSFVSTLANGSLPNVAAAISQ